MLGTTIGLYQIRRQIGQGGMGEVYEAVHQQLGRRVAIKILHPEYARNQEVLTRFFNEARAVNVINHPALVQISEFGQLPNGSAFLVMEFLDGETLSARLKRVGGSLPEPDVLRLGWQLASVLTATHAQGIVHRDLKPGNIMLVPDPAMPGGERLKLLDFGIAKVGNQNRGEGEPKTRTGMLMGTPHYMSPEQCRGAGLVDEKADVYSFGVILYHMLAGRPPFTPDGDGAIIAAHLYEAPIPLLRFAPQTTEALAEIIDLMLRKGKTERPFMKEIADVLQQMERGTEVVSSLLLSRAPSTPMVGGGSASATAISLNNPSTIRQTNGQMVKPRKLPTYALALVGLVVVAGVVGIMALRAINGPEPARPSETKATPTPRAAASVSKVHWAVTSIPPGAEVVRASDQQVLGKTPWQIEESAGDGKLELLLRHPGYRNHSVMVDKRQSGVYQETLEAVAARSQPRSDAPKPQRVAGAPKQNPCPNDDICRPRAEKAMHLYAAKHYDEALRDFQSAYTLAQEAPRLLIHIGLCLAQLGRHEQALQFYQSYQRSDPKADGDTKSRVSSYIAESKNALSLGKTSGGH